ncbi:MAG: hypothetical protein Q8O37_14660 [Sulfuricellaceae bacterium]|nr:hypothetical protein [Sulfuricellaceae bacterium]
MQGHLFTTPNWHGDTQKGTRAPPKIMKHRLAMPVSLSPNSLPKGERDVGSLREFHTYVGLPPQIKTESRLALTLAIQRICQRAKAEGKTVVRPATLRKMEQQVSQLRKAVSGLAMTRDAL